ncbi:hypothetical protein [Parahaliea aestuarii]|uniref:Uncharacterized protein n=1 Tax=Parahaliea aestuarii TaxID=1852021 RepID=A0A5C8ZXS2_9GAMM|nr:hypothetical protein [Parahaliea aestuarii]TXS93276.1 hypothetical protein FVW59_05390 [Parahaliea aestuarii]
MPELRCPYCASRATASRRTLFLALMRERDLPPLFEWYGLKARRSCPPRSLFFLLGLCLAGMAVPALLLWVGDAIPALRILGAFAALLGLALLLDLLVTMADYRSWHHERVCAQCRQIYRTPAAPGR